MKITVDLPKDLFVAARKEAAERRVSLKALVESGLRRELASGRRSEARREEARRVRWVTVAGGLPPGVDVADRESIYERMRSGAKQGVRRDAE